MCFISRLNLRTFSISLLDFITCLSAGLKSTFLPVLCLSTRAFKSHHHPPLFARRCKPGSCSLQWDDVLSNHWIILKTFFSILSNLSTSFPNYQTQPESAGAAPFSSSQIFLTFIQPKRTLVLVGTLPDRVATWPRVPTASHIFLRTIGSQDTAQHYTGPIKTHHLFSSRLLMESKSFCTRDLPFNLFISSSCFDLTSKIDQQ